MEQTINIEYATLLSDALMYPEGHSPGSAAG